ncbi:hypothetical protein THAOC_35837, partial [Thalassiosira oceanica]
SDFESLRPKLARHAAGGTWLDSLGTVTVQGTSTAIIDVTVMWVEGGSVAREPAVRPSPAAYVRKSPGWPPTAPMVVVQSSTYLPEPRPTAVAVLEQDGGRFLAAVSPSAGAQQPRRGVSDGCSNFNCLPDLSATAFGLGLGLILMSGFVGSVAFVRAFPTTKAGKRQGRTRNKDRKKEEL